MDTKCPYCGEEMVLGYIRSRDGVVWAKDPSGISSIPWLASGPMGFPRTRYRALRKSRVRRLQLHEVQENYSGLYL